MKRKVAAFILRENPSGRQEILFHEFVTNPTAGWRLPGGGVDKDETPDQALYRELSEETGVNDWQFVRKLGVQSYFKSYIQSDVERHDYLLRAPAGLPDGWEHHVKGDGADAGDLFRFHWLDAHNLAGIDGEHSPFITPDYIPELFPIDSHAMHSDEDWDLIKSARDIIAKRYKPDFHHVGAALRTKSGKVFAAVHLEANVGRIAVCAEAVAIGMAAAAGDTDIEVITAVIEDGTIVSPCGMCRELISDYAPDALAIVPSENGSERVAVGELLPNKYQ